MKAPDQVGDHLTTVAEDILWVRDCIEATEAIQESDHNPHAGPFERVEFDRRDVTEMLRHLELAVKKLGRLREALY